MGGFIYCLLGTTSHVTIGPVSILALMTGTVLPRDKHGASICQAWYFHMPSMVFPHAKDGAST
jgi:MFS superfamily sulfate permease-like transporter